MTFQKGHPPYLLHHWEETRKKIKLHHKNVKGGNNPFYGKHHSLKTRKIMVEKRRYRVIPLVDTKLEKKLQSELLLSKIIFEKHKPIYGQPDIFIKPNICIFVDGCYWRGCNRCKVGIENKNYLVRRKIDRQINRKLRLNGYIVFRFWEHEINKNIQKCVSLILKTSSQRVQSVSRYESN